MSFLRLVGESDGNTGVAGLSDVATKIGIKGTVLIGWPLKDECTEGGFTIALRDWDHLLEKKERADEDWSTWFVVWDNVDSSPNEDRIPELWTPVLGCSFVQID